MHLMHLNLAFNELLECLNTLFTTNPAGKHSHFTELETKA